MCMEEVEDFDISIEPFYIQWIGLETAENIPSYIVRYYNSLHVKVSTILNNLNLNKICILKFKIL